MNPPEDGAPWDDTADRCRMQLPHDRLHENEPSFTEPWQAQAFALVVQLIDSGRIGWAEWSTALGAEIRSAASNGFQEDGSDYYLLWLRALERVLSDRKLVSPAELETLVGEWRHAYNSTPHGQPVTLTESPQRSR